MAGRVLGEAFVVISPAADQFLTELVTKVNAAIKAYKPPTVTVPVEADTKPAIGALGSLAAYAKTLYATLGTLRADVSTTAGQAQLAKLQAQVLALAKQMGSLGAKVDVTDLAAFEAKLLAITAAAEKFNDAMSGQAMGPVTRELADLQARVDKLAATLANIPMDGNSAALNAKIAAMLASALALRDSLKNIDIGGDPAELARKTAAVLGLQAAFEKLGETAAGPVLGPVTMQLAKMQELAAALSDTLAGMKADVDDAAANAKLAELRLQAMKLQESLKDVTISGDPVKMAAFTAQLLGLQAAIAKLNDTGAKTAGIPVFQGGWWGGSVMGISFWHIALDAAIEAIIIATTSMLALGAAFAVAYPAIDQVAYSTEHSLQAMTALGVDAGPLAGKLDAIQKAMAPRVIEAYGGALSILTGQTGALSKVGAEVVTGFDDMIARVDIWMKSQKDMSGILQSGVNFLGQMAKILGTLGQAIANLVQKDPGIAKFLLNLVQLAASMINMFSKLPAPLIQTALAIHGIYLWVSVLVVAPVLKMAEAIGILSAEQTAAAASGLKFKNVLMFLLTNPYGWAVAAGAALAYLSYESYQVSAATQDFLNKQAAWLSTLPASTLATTGLAEGIGQIENKMHDLNLSSEMAQWHGFSNIAQETGDKIHYFGHELGQTVQGGFLHQLGAIGDFLHGVFSPGFAAAGAASVALQNDLAGLNQRLNQLVGSYHAVYAETGNLMREGFSFQQSLGLMDLAGVQWNDSLTLMETKVNNLIRGYNDMSIGGGILANSISALNFQTEQQDSKVTQLNSAWDTFFQTVSGGASTFNSFATQTIGLYQSLGDVSDRLSVSNGRTSISLQNTAAATKNQTASMTGLNQASLQARDAFLQTASAANSQMDSLTLLASAAGLGSRGTDMLTQATKDMVEQLLPAAKGSSEMTAVLEALAQRGGFQPGGTANMFSQLAKWVGNTKDPMESLDKIVTTFTTDAAGLTQDVKNLSVALGTTLTGAMSQAILVASGGTKPFDDFATALMNTGVNSTQTISTGKVLAEELLRLTGNTQQAHDQFVTMTESMTGSKAASEQLWNQISGSLTPSVGALSGQVVNTMNSFEDFAGKGLNETRGQADTLLGKLQKELGPEIDQLRTGPVTQAKAKFEAWAGKGGAEGLGLTAAQADWLWNHLGTLQSMIDSLHGANISIKMQGTGTYTIGQMLSSGQAIPGITQGIPQGIKAQTGLKLPGWGGGDRIPIMAEAGETILPKQATADPLTHLVASKYHVPGFSGSSLAGGVLGLSPSVHSLAGPEFGYGMLRGYAQGGTVGNAATPTPNFPGNPPWPVYTGNLTTNFVGQMYTDMISQFEGSMLGSMSAALKQAETSYLGTTASNVLAYAESFIGKVPYVWGGDTPSGWDCSGFVSYVLENFGLLSNRMVAAGLQAWAKPSLAAPGALAFYGSPAHHVGFVVNGSTLLSALGTGFGTTLSSLNLGDNSGYGVPPSASSSTGGDPSGTGAGTSGPGYWQAVAREMSGQYGWANDAEFSALVDLWNRESGWNPGAINPSSGAAGIPQDITGNMHGGGVGQIAWGLAYIASRYGDPIAAWAHEVANNWYKHGGIVSFDTGGILPPGVTLAYNGTGANETILPAPPEAIAGYAVGGVVQAYRAHVGSDQAAELKDYADFIQAGRSALSGAKSGSYLATHRKSILDEMATLAKRQAAEADAYKALTGPGLTVSDLSKLATRANDEITTTHDVALGHLPGRSLGVLRSALAALSYLAKNPPSLLGAVGPGAETLFPTWPTPSGTVPQQQFWTWLPAIEHDEKAQYEKTVKAFAASLKAAKAGTWAYTHRATIDKELQTLALRQNEQLSDYSAVMLRTGYPPTASEVKKLQSAVKSMATTVQDADLSHVPGGHPALMSGIYRLLGQIYDLTGKGVGNPETPFPALFGTPALPKRGTQAYATLASIFGWYDRGGILPPGLTLAYNGTGRNEVVSPVPPAGTYGPGGMTHGQMQIVNRLDRLISLMSAAPAAYGQALNGVAAQASSRGYYGGTR